MFTIALCDDNEMFLEKMKKLIMECTEFTTDTTCECYTRGKDLLKSGTQKYDLVILDMQMDEMDGFHIARKLRKTNKRAVLAFCSGVVTPQPEHFEVQPFRYLLKSDSKSKQRHILRDLLQEMKREKETTRVEVVSDGRAYRIPVEDILYISKYKRKSLLTVDRTMEDGEGYLALPSSEKLVDWYEQLQDYGFEYAHSSYIVNLARIDGVVKEDIIMPNGEMLHISRACKAAFHEAFSHYFSKKYRRER